MKQIHPVEEKSNVEIIDNAKIGVIRMEKELIIPSKFISNMNSLENMGFHNEELCLNALKKYDNHLESAIELLVTNYYL